MVQAYFKTSAEIRPLQNGELSHPIGIPIWGYQLSSSAPKIAFSEAKHNEKKIELV